MLVRNLLDTKIQVFNTYSENIPSQIMSTRDALNYGSKYKPLIDKARTLYWSDKNGYKSIKDRFFVWLPSAVIGSNKSDTKHIYPIICIDIDGKDNPDIDMNAAKEQIFSLPFVYYAGLSIGGNGFFALAYIDDPLYFEEQFAALEDYIMEKFGLKIDSQCSNPNRLRYMSYDDNPLVKDESQNISPFTSIKFKPTIQYNPIVTTLFGQSGSSNDLINDDRFCISVLDYCINKLYYQSGKRTEGWIQDLGLLKLFGCEGEQLALQLSRQSQGYISDKDVLHTFHKGGLKSKRELMTKFFGMCKNSLGKGWIYKIKDEYNLD